VSILWQHTALPNVVHITGVVGLRVWAYGLADCLVVYDPSVFGRLLYV
jgi:hypothetical protein